MKKYIEEQPRGLSENELLLKVNDLVGKANLHHERIAALEAAATHDNKTDNEGIKRALMDAHSALEKAISFFRTKAEENKK